MILTRTHAMYFAARRLPKALRSHAQDVTIDQVVNAHVKRPKGWPGKSEPHNTLSVLRTIRKRDPQGALFKVIEWACYGWPGLGTGPDEHGRVVKIDRRYAYAIKWKAKIDRSLQQRGTAKEFYAAYAAHIEKGI